MDRSTPTADFFPTAAGPSGWGAGSLEFPVPRVLHSVWRSPEGWLGIVLVGWSSEPATWQAGFDPRVYGLGGEQYEVLERLPGGVRRRLAVCDDAPVVLGGDLFLGKMPARSLRVIEVTRA